MLEHGPLKYRMSLTLSFKLLELKSKKKNHQLLETFATRCACVGVCVCVCVSAAIRKQMLKLCKFLTKICVGLVHLFETA